MLLACGLLHIWLFVTLRKGRLSQSPGTLGRGVEHLPSTRRSEQEREIITTCGSAKDRDGFPMVFCAGTFHARFDSSECLRQSPCVLSGSLCRRATAPARTAHYPLRSGVLPHPHGPMRSSVRQCDAAVKMWGVWLESSSQLLRMRFK